MTAPAIGRGRSELVTRPEMGSAGKGLSRWRLAPFLAFAIGAGQMIWIIVQLSIIKGISFRHPTFFGVGLVIAVASVFWGGASFRGWLASR